MIEILQEFDQEVYVSEDGIEKEINNLIGRILEKSSGCIEDLYSFFADILDNREEISQINHSSLILYNLSRLISNIIDLPIIFNAVENLWVKTWERKMANMSQSQLQSEIEKIGIQLTENGIHYSEFLNHFSKLHDPNYKLINLKLVAGEIQLTHHQKIHLIREYLRVKMKESRNPLKISIENEDINELIDEITKIVHTKKEYKIIDGEDPPCIKDIIKNANYGLNLGHSQRLAIAIYYCNKKRDEEKLLELFQNLPDYNEKITLYQIDSVRKKDYKMYSCQKMQSLGMCKIEGDEICSKGVFFKGKIQSIKSPLNFSFWKNKNTKK